MRNITEYRSEVTGGIPCSHSSRACPVSLATFLVSRGKDVKTIKSFRATRR